MQCNLSNTDRTIRVIAGLLLAGAGILLVRGLVGILLALLGAVLIFSGSIGFCHVYKFFHIDTSKKP